MLGLKVHLQVALDLIDKNKALQIAKMAYDGGADFIEAGTPLIKRYGVHIIHDLRSNIPNATFIADMKTMDAADIEVSIAAESGADIITVMALASDETIALAAETAHNLGCKVMVDMMNVTDVFKRSQEVFDLGADYICLHVGVDVQRRLGITAETLLKEVSRISKVFPGRVAVAGGINDKRAGSLVKAGASIIIVGSAIIKAPDPLKATKTIRKAIEEALSR